MILVFTKKWHCYFCCPHQKWKQFPLNGQPSCHPLISPIVNCCSVLIRHCHWSQGNISCPEELHTCHIQQKCSFCLVHVLPNKNRQNVQEGLSKEEVPHAPFSRMSIVVEGKGTCLMAIAVTIMAAVPHMVTEMNQQRMKREVKMDRVMAIAILKRPRPYLHTPICSTTRWVIWMWF